MKKIFTYPLEYVDYFLLNEIEAKDLTGLGDSVGEVRCIETDELLMQYAVISRKVRLC